MNTPKYFHDLRRRTCGGKCKKLSATKSYLPLLSAWPHARVMAHLWTSLRSRARYHSLSLPKTTAHHISRSHFNITTRIPEVSIRSSSRAAKTRAYLLILLDLYIELYRPISGPQTSARPTFNSRNKLFYPRGSDVNSKLLGQGCVAARWKHWRCEPPPLAFSLDLIFLFIADAPKHFSKRKLKPVTDHKYLHNAHSSFCRTRITEPIHTRKDLVSRFGPNSAHFSPHNDVGYSKWMCFIAQMTRSRTIG